MRLVFLGAPGAGKGTQAVFLKQKLGLAYIATGDLLREAIKQNSQLGQQVKDYVEKGKLVPDKFIIALIKESLSESGCQAGFILDGFPRNPNQAKALQEVLGELSAPLDAVFYLDLNKKEVIDRLSARRICSVCSRIYNLKTNPPATPERCNICNGKLVVRKDDQPETIARRYEIFRQETKPLLTYYRKQGLLRTVPAGGEITRVRNEIWRSLATNPKKRRLSSKVSVGNE